MEVGAVGGMAMGGAGAMAGGAAVGASTATASTGAASVCQNSAMDNINLRFLDGAFPFGLQNLAETLKNFSSAEILFTLMLLAAMEKDDKKSGGSSAAMGLLAGLAMAGQFGRGPELACGASVPQVGFEGGVGGNLNISG